MSTAKKAKVEEEEVTDFCTWNIPMELLLASHSTLAVR